MSDTPNASAGEPVGPETRRLVDTFLEAVRIDSPSGEEAGFAAWCAARLHALGASVRFDGSATAALSDIGNLIADLPGTAEGRTIVLSAHLDTVEPGRGIEPVIEDGEVRSAGDTILAADDKSGIAAMFEALTRLKESGEPHAPIRLLLTTGEEMGLRGAKQLEPADCAGDLCVVLDADGAPGGVVTAAPTHHTFTATFRGRSAHAGVEPERGVSAVRMAARAIDTMRLGRLDEHTTANIGRIEGGRATNVVPEECTMIGECRSLDAPTAERVRAEMDAAMRAAAADAGGTVDVAWTKEYDGFVFDTGDPLLRMVQDACVDAGLTPRLFATGGGSDGNVLTAKGLPTLVLSCGMRQVHSTSERVAIADMEAMVRLLLAVLRRAVSR